MVQAQIAIPLPILPALNGSDALFQDFDRYVVQPMTNYRSLILNINFYNFLFIYFFCKDFLLANQLPYNATYEAGKAITIGLIGWFASWPRYQIWDITNQTFLQSAGLKQFLIPPANGTDLTSLYNVASGYGQGLVLFTLFGIAGMLVTVLFGLRYGVSAAVVELLWYSRTIEEHVIFAAYSPQRIKRAKSLTTALGKPEQLSSLLQELYYKYYYLLSLWYFCYWLQHGEYLQIN